MIMINFGFFVKQSGKTTAQLADLCGTTEDTVLRYLNKINSLKVNEATLRMIIAMAGGVYEDFVYDKPIHQSKDEENNTEPSADFQEVIASNKEVVAKLDGLIEATNNLAEILERIYTNTNSFGNVALQNMEYLKLLVDYQQGSNSYLKQLNDKWNKPSAYRK